MVQMNIALHMVYCGVTFSKNLLHSHRLVRKQNSLHFNMQSTDTYGEILHTTFKLGTKKILVPHHL